MRILIADDDRATRKFLEATLSAWGYELTVCVDGREALASLLGNNPPDLAILDWMMPALPGPEICRRLRATQTLLIYVILLTANARAEDVVTAFEAGVDDYIVKPFNPAELRARIQVGLRIVTLQKALAGRVLELEAALAQVNRLQGLLPICSYCKKIRDDQNYWQQVDRYVSEHSDVQFSHGICPDCYEHVIRTELDPLDANSTPSPRQ